MKKIVFTLGLFFSFPVFAALPPEFYMSDPSCPKNAPFRYADWDSYEYGDGGEYVPYGECISCDTGKGLTLVNENDCTLCSNRVLKNGECKLKKCPPNKPFYEEYANWSGCKSCQDEPTFIKKTECQKCSNMHWVEYETHLDMGKKKKVGFCAPSRKNKIYHSMNFLTKEGNIGDITGGKFPFESDCNDPHVKKMGGDCG